MINQKDDIPVKKKKRKLKILIVSIISTMLAVLLVVFPIATIVVYESTFGMRCETASCFLFSVEDFDGLQVKRSDFVSGDITLAGFQYKKESDSYKGVVVTAHGLGGGGHNNDMPIIDYFTTNGYLVFTYDAHGNDNSGGKVMGVPQGLIDLDNAISYVETLPEYQGLPIMLYGHSWGGYSVGNVLNMHPEVKAVALLSGFNEASDLIKYQGKQMIGGVISVLMPYVKLYENIKFGGEYATATAAEGLKNTDANVLIVHSKDDTTVPFEYGYGVYHEEFIDSPRFTFVEYEDKGHNVYLSRAALEYAKQINDDYQAFLDSTGQESTVELRNAFCTDNLDLMRYYEIDADLFALILTMYDSCCQK